MAILIKTWPVPRMWTNWKKPRRWPSIPPSNQQFIQRDQNRFVGQVKLWHCLPVGVLTYNSAKPKITKPFSRYFMVLRCLLLRISQILLVLSRGATSAYHLASPRSKYLNDSRMRSQVAGQNMCLEGGLACKQLQANQGREHSIG